MSSSNSEADLTPRQYEIDPPFSTSQLGSGILVSSPFSNTIKLNRLQPERKTQPADANLLRENAALRHRASQLEGEVHQVRQAKVLLREKDRRIAELQEALGQRKAERQALQQRAQALFGPHEHSAERVVRSLEEFKAKLERYIAHQPQR